MKKNYSLILASSSKYRKELLSRLRIPFICIPPEIDESPIIGEKIEETVLRLAISKSKIVSNLNHNSIVIGSDQIASCDNKIIGKPGNFLEARKQLEYMSGKEVFFFGAIAVTDGHNTKTAMSITKCQFKNLDYETITNYLELEKPFDIAGSTKSEGLGIVLIESIYSNDPTAIMGMSMIQLTNILNDFNINPLRLLK